MLSNSKLSKSLWTETLKMVVYILNRIPTKVISKTPIELWKGRKLSLQHIHIWKCPLEAKIYNPREKKLDSRNKNGYFIGYAERSKCYRFYCPTHGIRFVESRNANYLENDLIGRSNQSIELISEHEHTDTPSSSKRSTIVHTPLKFKWMISNQSLRSHKLPMMF